MSAVKDRIGVLLKSIVTRHGLKLSILAFLIGLGWLFYFPNLARYTYFSEPSLKAGIRVFEWKPEDVDLAVELETQMSQNNCSQESILAAFTSRGLRPRVHTFNHTDSTPGYNVQGTIRSKTSDGADSIVLTTSFATRATSTTPHQCHPAGLALLLAFTKAHSRVNVLSKDVIILGTDDTALAGNGIEHWVDDYYSPTRLAHAGNVHRGGDIRNAFHLDFTGDPAVDPVLAISGEGFNGQLVNMDILNILSKLEGQGIRKVLLSREEAGVPGRTWISSVLSERSRLGRHLASWSDLLSFMTRVATGRSTGPHGFFQRYNVPAVTLSYAGPRQHISLAQADPKAVTKFAHAFEFINAQVHTMSEEFHQSFYYYVMLNPKQYISIGEYLPCVGLMLLALIIRAYHYRFIYAMTDSIPALVVIACSMATGVAVLGVMTTAMAVLGGAGRDPVGVQAAALFLALAVLVALWNRSQAVATAYFLFDSVTGTSSSFDDIGRANDTSTVLQCFTMTVSVVALATIALINYPLGLFATVVASPLQLFLSALAHRHQSALLGVVLIVTSPPTIVIALSLLHSTASNALFTSTQSMLHDYHHFGTLNFVFMCLVYVPLHGLWCAVWGLEGKGKHTSSKTKRE